MPALRAKTTELELVHPTDGKVGWVLQIHGFDSAVVRSAIKRIAADRAERTEGKQVSVLERLNQDEQDNADIAAAAIAGWNDAFAEADESIGPYKPETAIKLMRDVEVSWVREQVEACLRKRENFFRKD